MDTRPLPDRKYLQRAFNFIHPASWGDDLDATLEHPIRSIAVIAVARRMQREGEPTEPDKPAEYATRNRPLQAPRHPPIMDFKRLASGEREDD
jgi:hypothetical protein